MSPVADGFPRVQGRCPRCGLSSLFLGGGGYVTCSSLECRDPIAATTLLERGNAPGMLRGWVQELPLREQGVLLSGMRGCDLTPKEPLDSSERQLVSYLRYVVCHPNDESEVGAAPGAYMQGQPPTKWTPSEFGHYPQHWYAHIMHAFQVVGYRHPDPYVSAGAEEIYLRFVHSLHLEPESFETMVARLSEVRSVELGNLVS